MRRDSQSADPTRRHFVSTALASAAYVALNDRPGFAFALPEQAASVYTQITATSRPSRVSRAR